MAAGPETPREVSLAEVDRSDVYIGILAHRYGSGITEAEYRRARQKKIPCLIYLKSEDVPVVPAYLEKAPEKVAKLEALKRELKQHHTISFFKNPDHLATQVVADLHNHFGIASTMTDKQPSPTPKYQINIGEAHGIVIGDHTHVIQSFDKSEDILQSSSSTTPDVTILRLKHLEENIQQDMQLLKEYEDTLRYEDDPHRRAKYHREIERLQRSAARYQREYDELRIQASDESPTKMGDIAEQLEQMDSKLDDLLEGQIVIRTDVREMQQVILARFDVSERTIVTVFVELLEQNQVTTVDAVLEALEADRVPSSLLEETLTVVQEAMAGLPEIRDDSSASIPVHEFNQALEIVQSPQFDVRHKLKVAAPIIPLILSYEAELELGSGLNLEAAWRRLVARVRESLS